MRNIEDVVFDKEMPKLSGKERDRRWKQIWGKMDLAGLDCLLVWGNESKWKTALGNIRYISGRPLPGLLLFPLKGEPIVWSGFPHDCTNWTRVPDSWVKDLRPGSPIPVDDVVDTIKQLGFEKGNIGVIGFGSTRPQVVPDTVLYRPYQNILRALPQVCFSDHSGMVEELRMIKGQEEITLLEKSAQLAERMFAAMVESCQPGIRECEVYAAMLQSLVAGGGEEDMIWMATGHTPPPHGRRPPPSRRLLEKGDIVVVEYHSNYEGYLIGVEHSISIGQPREEYKRIHGICEEVHKGVMEVLKHGVSLEAVVKALRQPVLKSKMGYVECGFHGHGLSSPEFPSCMYGGSGGSWEEHIYAKVPAIDLQEGMVVSTGVDLYDPTWNPETGLMSGDTFLITRNGPRKMTDIPIEFTIT
ncbi:MAG: M24 family metallopeptidase [Desulfobacterales bacterium]|nr:M24 family metallopeptidase [Desulfobacterales bacterium]